MLNSLGYWNYKENKPSFWGTGDDLWEFITYYAYAEYAAAAVLGQSVLGTLKCASWLASALSCTPG